MNGDDHRPVLSDKDRIDILMKEYDTLRQEIIARTNNRFLLVSVLGALIGFIVITDNSFTRTIVAGITLKTVLLIIGGVALLGVWTFLGYLIGVAAGHVTTIEDRVNQIAGETLLRWESLHGWGKWGKYFGTRKKTT